MQPEPPLHVLTDMQENTWARLRDSRPGARAFHATQPTYFLYFCKAIVTEREIKFSCQHTHQMGFPMKCPDLDLDQQEKREKRHTTHPRVPKALK